MTLHCFSSKHRDIELQQQEMGDFSRKKREISPERNGDPSWLIGHKREFTQGKVTQTVTFKYVDKDYRVTSGLKMSPCAKHRKTPECSKSLAQDHITHSILGWSLKPAVMCFFLLRCSSSISLSLVMKHIWMHILSRCFLCKKGTPFHPPFDHPIKIAIWGVYPLVW